MSTDQDPAVVEYRATLATVQAHVSFLVQEDTDPDEDTLPGDVPEEDAENEDA